MTHTYTIRFLKNSLRLVLFFSLTLLTFLGCGEETKNNNKENLDKSTGDKGSINEILNSESVLVAAHRGDWRNAPENSIRAFENCVEMGVDIIEIDVRLTKDNVPVIIHDETLDRTTTGTGYVNEWTLDSLRTLNLRTGIGVVTSHKIPTLEEVMQVSKNRILVYLDKSKDKIDKILPVLEKTQTHNQTIFVLDYPYQEAKQIFGTSFKKVIYMPVVSDEIDFLEGYVQEFLEKYQPIAFQFRMDSMDSKSYQLLEKVSNSPSQIFVAATWAHHSIGHDDNISLEDPENGWGWLVKKGISILETDRPGKLLEYLRDKGLHD